MINERLKPVGAKTNVTTNSGSGLRSSDRAAPRTATDRSSVSTGPSAPSRPAIPVKPSHLSPIVTNGGYKRSASDLRPKLNSVTNKVNNSATSPLIAEAKNGHILTSAAVSGVGSSKLSSKSTSKDVSEVENVRLNLQPVVNNNNNNNNNKIHSEKQSSSSKQRAVVVEDEANVSDDEEGIKRISADSIQNIRRDANVMSFQFTGGKSSPGGGQSHLPGANKVTHLPPGDKPLAQPNHDKKLGGVINATKKVDDSFSRQSDSSKKFK